MGLVETLQKTWEDFVGDNNGETEDFVGDNIGCNKKILSDNVSYWRFSRW